MGVKDSASTAPTPLTIEQVKDFLRGQPNFLNDHPELLEILLPPEADHGGGVLDFQRYALDNLQKSMQSIKGKFDALIHSSRDNMSTQIQVHQAVLGLIRARNLEQLLEVLTLDLVNLFDVDVVRLAIESDMADVYDAAYGDQSYSGVSFIDPNQMDFIFGAGKPALLCGNIEEHPIPEFDRIFADCSELVESCALLRLHLETIGRGAILAFGIRHKNRFQAGQGIELLSFLARIVEHRLDICLSQSEIEGVI